MPNETQESGKMYMDNLKMLPLICNREHIQVAINIVSLFDLIFHFLYIRLGFGMVY